MIKILKVQSKILKKNKYIKGRSQITHHKNLKTSHLLTNSQVGSLALGKDLSLGAHPHKLGRFGWQTAQILRLTFLIHKKEKS